jgi:hypothetical protein
VSAILQGIDGKTQRVTIEGFLTPPLAINYVAVPCASQPRLFRLVATKPILLYVEQSPN